MTISSTVRKAGPYAGTGAQTAFTFAFKVFANTDVLVVQTDASGVDTTQVLTTNYTVALNGDQDGNPGGTVNMLVAPPSGYKLTIGSQVPDLQGTQLLAGGNFNADVITTAFDRATIQIQQLAELTARQLTFPISDNGVPVALPSAATRANNALIFDVNGQPTVGAIPSNVAVNVAMFPFVQSTTIANAQAALGVAAQPVDFTSVETTDATINGTGKLWALFSNTYSALKLYIAEVAGGTRLWLWPAATAVPNIPHTGVPPTLAVYGDVLLGDIVALASNPMTYFIRANTGLAETAVTQLFSAQHGSNDTDGGAQIIMAPVKNAGGAVNDGYVDLVAYGKGSGSVANCVSLATRDSAGVALRRWQVNGQSANKGDFTPYVHNTYDIASTGVGVRELYLGAGASASTGKALRLLSRQANAGTGSPADTNENDLKSLSVLANTLNTNGDTLRFSAGFRCAANADTKRIKIKFGATTLIDSTALAHNGTTIRVEGVICRTGATSQVAYVSAHESANNPAWSTNVTGGESFTSPAETLSGAVTLKATVQLGTGTLNDVIQDYFFVEYIPN